MKNLVMTLAVMLLAMTGMVQSSFANQVTTTDQNSRQTVRTHKQISPEEETNIMARVYHLNTKQIAKLEKLNQKTFEKREKIRKAYMEKSMTASAEQKLKLEKKHVAQMEKVQDAYNDQMFEVLNKRQYKKYCMDFQLRQARFYQSQVKMNESRV